ncbi:hypothetical protein EHS25_009573 [Saitozyma podzolica]|uniref:Major facilitator superfamily (MFS) profile domain-containing protein n=1 Tax=Saitozyma podzolica TaxID=1890683 RepID=A0A427YJK3_9TREE|nr:hypothetical protein EHS25_009573 [Saitozyma podzolica]
MSAAGGSTLNIALPTIQTELNIRETDLQWITSAYNLTNGCFLLLSGRVADIYGRKLVFLCGIMWVGIWTLVGSFMHSGVGLIVSRAMAGCGAAMATPSAIGIIAANFRGQARSTAFAAFAAGAPVGGSVGLVLGGIFVEYVPYSWRAVLCIMAGICFVMAIAAFFVLPRDTLKVVDPRLDWPGAVLVTVGLVLLMFVISDGQNAPNGWKTGYIIAMLILGVLFIVGFFLWERHVVYKTTRPPLMRLQLWTRANGRLASVYFIGFVSWMGFVSLSYHATLFYQQVQQVGAIGAMLRFIPCPVSGILCNVLVAQLVSRVPTQLLVCTGVTATGIANVLMALSPADVVYWRLPFNAMWMTVMGADFLMATGSIFVAKLALPDEQSVAGALNQTLVQLGGSFGLALTTVISASYQSRALSRGLEAIPSLLEGIHAAFWLGAGFSFSAMFIGVVMLRGMGTIGKVKKDEKEEEKEDDSAEQGQGEGAREVRGDEKV